MTHTYIFLIIKWKQTSQRLDSSTTACFLIFKQNRNLLRNNIWTLAVKSMKWGFVTQCWCRGPCLTQHCYHRCDVDAPVTAQHSDPDFAPALPQCDSAAYKYSGRDPDTNSNSSGKTEVTSHIMTWKITTESSFCVFSFSCRISHEVPRGSRPRCCHWWESFGQNFTFSKWKLFNLKEEAFSGNMEKTNAFASVLSPGCNANILWQNQPSRQVDMVKDAFWDYVAKATVTAEDSLQQIRQSELGKEVK